MNDSMQNVITTRFKKSLRKKVVKKPLLTETEVIIAKWRYCDELTQKEIAELRGCTVRTVESHCLSIFVKLGTSSNRVEVKQALVKAKIIKGKPYV